MNIRETGKRGDENNLVEIEMGKKEEGQETGERSIEATEVEEKEKMRVENIVLKITRIMGEYVGNIARAKGSEKTKKLITACATIEMRKGEIQGILKNTEGEENKKQLEKLLLKMDDFIEENRVRLENVVVESVVIDGIEKINEYDQKIEGAKGYKDRTKNFMVVDGMLKILKKKIEEMLGRVKEAENKEKLGKLLIKVNGFMEKCQTERNR